MTLLVHGQTSQRHFRYREEWVRAPRRRQRLSTRMKPTGEAPRSQRDLGESDSHHPLCSFSSQVWPIGKATGFQPVICVFDSRRPLSSYHIVCG
jgi:hypothetical protein